MNSNAESIDVSNTNATPSSGPVAMFSSVNGELVKLIAAVSEAADKGPSRFLFTVGGVGLMLALLAKIQILGQHLFVLQTQEFIVFVLASTLLIICGAYLKLYEFKARQTTIERQQKLGATLLETSAESGKKLVENTFMQNREPPNQL